jgi:hypothetical protein
LAQQFKTETIETVAFSLGISENTVSFGIGIGIGIGIGSCCWYFFHVVKNHQNVIVQKL